MKKILFIILALTITFSCSNSSDDAEREAFMFEMDSLIESSFRTDEFQPTKEGIKLCHIMFVHDSTHVCDDSHYIARVFIKRDSIYLIPNEDISFAEIRLDTELDTMVKRHNLYCTPITSPNIHCITISRFWGNFMDEVYITRDDVKKYLLKKNNGNTVWKIDNQSNKKVHI